MSYSIGVGQIEAQSTFLNAAPNGDYLQIAVWAGKTDPAAEVVNVQVRHMSDGEWMTAGKLAVYRAKDGSYTQLPDKPPTPSSKPPSKQLDQTDSSTDLD